jgi:hypothetical protein
MNYRLALPILVKLILLGLTNTCFSFSSIKKESIAGYLSFISGDFTADQIQYGILDEEQTLEALKSIELVNNERDMQDIFIHAKNGNSAYFSSYNSCEGQGPSYSIIGSIPELDLVFIDRTTGCHGGEALILVSLKDGVMRELNCFGIYQSEQISISPDNSYLVFSSCDCSMGYSCSLEIISAKYENSNFYETKFFDESSCVCSPIQWISNVEFHTKTAIQSFESLDDCDKKNVKFIFYNGAWGVFK